MSDWWSSDPAVERTPDGIPRITVRPTGGDWWSSDPVAPSYASDAVQSAGAGLVRGAAGLVGLPEAVARYGGDAISAATNFVGRQLGVETPRPKGPPLIELPSTDKLLKDYQAEAGPLYEPKYKSGEYARTAAEFVPGALAGPAGSARQVAANLVKYGVVPGATSEAAGQATKGGSLETPARIGGALVGAGGAALATRPATSARAIREQLPPGVTPQMVDQAEALIVDAAQQGVALTWPEALSQVAGRPVLSNLARHLEAAPASEARMAEFYGQRPQQVEAAGRQAMGGIAPPNAAPSTIGPAVGRAAEDTANDVRGIINANTDPLYQASAPTLLTPAEMGQVRRITPGFAAARDAIRADPQLNRYVAHLPDNSVGFLNEVKKYLGTQAENAASPVQQGRNMQRAAGFSSDERAVRQAAIDASGRAAGPGNPNLYEAALNAQEQMRRQYLEPLLQGPLGKLADKDITTRNAINALFPPNPLPNSADEIATAVGALAQRAPRAASDLVRAHTESVFNEATQALQGGANQAGGAKFRVELVGNPQQRANFEAAVTALPNGAQRLAGFNRFLDIMEATGTRQNVGSKTAYNVEFLKDASRSGLVGEAAKGAVNPFGRGAQFLADKYERWRLGQNLNELADILTNPAAANQLRAIARMPVNSRQAQGTALRLVTLSEAATLERPAPVQQQRQ